MVEGKESPDKSQVLCEAVCRRRLIALLPGTLGMLGPSRDRPQEGPHSSSVTQLPRAGLTRRLLAPPCQQRHLGHP